MGRYRRVGWVRRPGRPTATRPPTALGHGRAWPTGPATASACCRAASASGCCSPGPSPRRPRLLLLDEPFNGVDATTTELAPRRAAPRCAPTAWPSSCPPTTCRSPTSRATRPACSTATRSPSARSRRRSRAELLRATYGGSALAARRAATPSSPCDGVRRATRLLIEPFDAGVHAAGADRGACCSACSAASSACTCCCAGWRSSPRSCSTPCSPASPSPSPSGSRCSSARCSAALVSVVLLTLLARRPRLDPDAALAVLIAAFFALGVVVVSRAHAASRATSTRCCSGASSRSTSAS